MAAHTRKAGRGRERAWRAKRGRAGWSRGRTEGMAEDVPSPFVL